MTLSQIVRGPFDNTSLGYAIGRDFSGRGLATAAVAWAVEHAWGSFGLHRVQAAARCVSNHASHRVLEKNGFRREGTALNYLRIGGAWTDHHLFARTVEDPAPAKLRPRAPGM